MSFSFLHEHVAGCSPLTPCLNCQIVKFLQTKLGDDFRIFIDMCGSEAEPPPEKLPLTTPIQIFLKDWKGQYKRAREGLQEGGVRTIEDVLKLRREELLSDKFPRFGEEAIDRLDHKLEQQGRHIGELA